MKEGKKGILERGGILSGGGSAMMHHGFWEGKAVAIKAMFSDSPTQKIKNSEKFRNERELLELLGSHPHVIQLIHAIENPPQLILEVGQIELRRRLFPVFPMEKIEWTVRMQFSIQIAEGVIYIQSKDICHLDLNPENIVIMSDEKTVKIIDFGNAKKLHANQDSCICNCTFGTPGYVAPEADNGIYGFKSDVWAFGVILWVLVTYKDARKEHNGQWDFSPPAEFPECTSSQIAFMQSFWQREPKERPVLDESLVTDMKKQFNIPETKEPASTKCLIC